MQQVYLLWYLTTCLCLTSPTCQGAKTSSLLCSTSSPRSASTFQKLPLPRHPAHTPHSHSLNNPTCSTHLTQLHGDIMLQVLGSLCPGLLTAALQAIGKLLEDGHGARHGGDRLGLRGIKSYKFFRETCFFYCLN